MTKLKITQSKKCYICGKGPKISFNRPKSLHKTKRVVFPNLQKFQGKLVCTACMRTMLKK